LKAFKTEHLPDLKMLSKRGFSSSLMDNFTGTADAPAIFYSSYFVKYPFTNTRKFV